MEFPEDTMDIHLASIMEAIWAGSQDHPREVEDKARGSNKDRPKDSHFFVSNSYQGKGIAQIIAKGERIDGLKVRDVFVISSVLKEL